MTNVFVVTPTEMTIGQETLAKVTKMLRDVYGITDELMYRQDLRNNDSKFLADNLKFAPTSAIVLAIDEGAMPIYDKDAMETEIVPLLREYPDHTSFEILATYILPLLQKAMDKKNTNE